MTRHERALWASVLRLLALRAGQLIAFIISALLVGFVIFHVFAIQ